MQARRASDRDGRSGVPLVLPPGMEIDLSVAEGHGHRLRPGRAERHEGAAESFRDVADKARRSGSTDQESWRVPLRRRQGRRVARAPDYTTAPPRALAA